MAVMQNIARGTSFPLAHRVETILEELHSEKEDTAAKAKKVESIATLQEKQRLVDARGSQLPKSTRATGKVDVQVAGTLFSSWHVCV